VATLTVLGVLLTHGSACDPVTAKRTTQQFVPVQAGTPVDVRTRNGWIKVIQGRPGIVAVTTHRRVTPLGGSEDGLDELKVKVGLSSGVLKIRGTHPADPKQRKYQVNFVLKVPPHTRLELRTEHGSLRVLNSVCDVEGKTGAGEIRARNVKGAVRLSTGSGNIELSGQVPRFQLETRVGDITATIKPGVPPTGDSHAHTQRGDVRLSLPAGRRATVTAETRNGRIHSQLPARSKRKGFLRSLVAGGGPGISLRTRRGQIRIQVAKAPADARETAPRQ